MGPYTGRADGSGAGATGTGLTELEEPIDTLDLKLFNLLRSKMIQELSIENIDEVIYLISDRVLEKYAAAVKGLYKDGN